MNTRIPTNQLDDLARRLPAPAERELPAGQQLRDQLIREFRQADGASKPAPRWWRRPQVAVPAVTTAIAAAGASAVLVAVSLSAAPGSSPGTPAARGSSAAVAPVAHSSPAAQLLAKIAVAAASQPAPVVRNSDYEYIKSVEQFTSTTSQHGKLSTTMQPPEVRETWTPVYNLCRPTRIHQPGLIEGRPTIQTNGLASGTKCPLLGSMANPTYQWETTAGTNPHVLLRRIAAIARSMARSHPGRNPYGKGQSLSTYEFSIIGGTLSDQIAPPAFGAALYRAAAMISGVTIIPDAVNAVGRHGVAVAIVDNGVRNEWIFDKTTLLMIGQRNVSARTGALRGTSAVVASGIVARIGQLPAGQH